MTNEEALNILRCERTEIKDRRGADFSGVEALDFAIKALEAQNSKLVASITVKGEDLQDIVDAIRKELACEDCISLNKLDDIITKAIDDSENQTECQTLRWVLDVMSELPSVIPKPKVGKWIKTYEPNDAEPCILWMCSKCQNAERGRRSKYCPNCGAKMEE